MARTDEWRGNSRAQQADGGAAAEPYGRTMIANDGLPFWSN